MPSNLRERALDAVPIRITNAADDRVIFLDQKFPSADRQVSKDEAAAVTCETQFCVEHHVRLIRTSFEMFLIGSCTPQDTFPM